MIYNAMPKVNGSGTDIMLENTADTTPLDIKLKGDTYQETTTGKNLLPPFGAKSNLSVGITSNEYEITVNGTSNNAGSIYSDNQITLPAGTYSLCKKYVSGSVDATFLYILRAVGGSTNTGEVSVGATTYENDVKSTFTLAEETTFNQYLYIGASGRNYSSYKMNVQIVSGSEADYNYEIYTNGSSPNPTFPQNIDVVTGDQNIKVQNKNLFDKNNTTVLPLAVNSTQVFNSTGGNGKSIYIPITGGLTYTISKIQSARFRVGTTAITPGNVVPTVDFQENDNATSITLNTSSTANYLIAYFYLNGTDTLTIEEVLNTMQIEVGSSASSYIAHQEQNYTIALGTTELCKIGTYQDYIYKSGSDWKIHREIGKVTLDEDSDISTHGYGTNSFQTNIENLLGNDSKVMTISNYFLGIKYNDRVTGTNTIYTVTNDIHFNLVIRNTEFTSLSNLKTWLSTHNTNVYYVLATPAEEAITEPTLVAQLNNIYYKAYSYKDQTNINSSGNLPLKLDVEAIKDMSSIFELLESQGS